MGVEMQSYWQNFIDGSFVDGSAGRLDVEDPATGERIAEQALAGPADIDRAVQAARRCHASGALTDLKDKAIASGMVALAERLQLTVVAEGVESEAQLDMLRDWGCHQWQGYYSSPAVSPERFASMLSDAPVAVLFNEAIM